MFALQTLFKRLAFYFNLKPERCPLWLGLLEKGGFPVYLFSDQDSNVSWRGIALLDTGNEGPNLVTEAAMRHVHGHSTGSKMNITTFDGQERTTEGEVQLSFAGPNGRCYRETFHCMSDIGGYDMILNHDFYLSIFENRIPGVFMIRRMKVKETDEQKKAREDGQKRQEEEAQRQAEQRRKEVQAKEAKRLKGNKA